MYKLICIDMDGTLLNSNKEISEINKAAIKSAYEKGVNVVITTGRLFINASYYSKLLGVKSPVIAANGAIIKGTDNATFIYKLPLSKDITRYILEVCEKVGLNPHFHTHENIFEDHSKVHGGKYNREVLRYIICLSA